MQESQQDTDSNTYERFVLYLYLSAAYANFEIMSSEKEMIREKMVKRGLLTETDFEKHWHKAWNDFRSHNDYESEQYIEKTCTELNLDKTAKQKIFDDLKDIIDADGREDASEKVNLFKFKKMLGV